MSLGQGLKNSIWTSHRRLVGTGLLVLFIVVLSFFNLKGALAAPTFSLEYYTDANLTLRSPSTGGRIVVSTGLVYVKLISSEALSSTPGDQKLTINAPGVNNDVNNQDFAWDAANNAWKYAWNVTTGNDGDTISMSVTGKDLLGNTVTSAPTSGGTVNINTGVLKIVSATSVNNSNVDVRFNKPLDPTTASDSTNYIISGGSGLTVSAASLDPADNDLVHLTTSSQQEFTYSIAVDAGVKDFTSNLIDPAFRTTTFAGSPLFDTAGTIDIKAVLCSSGRVEIRWDQFIGTASYTVLKSTDGNNWTSTNVGTALSYMDTAVTDYTNYFYKIRATDNITTMTSSAIPAFPPDSNVHGNYAENTGLCAACHVIHGAIGSKLIIATTKVNLCITCHDGTQSKYNILTGEVKLSAGYGESPSGPFGPLTEINENDANLQTVAGYTYDGSYDPVGMPTSIHNLGLTVKDAPGGNTQVVDAMECTTCHNPHGSSNYRILKTNLGTSGRIAPIQVEAYPVTGVSGETVNYISGMVDYCSACHSDFNQPSGSQNLGVDKTDQSGFNLAILSAGKRMHPVNMRLTVYDYTLGYGVPITTDLPTESWTGTPTVICMTCHYAHGTKKAFTPNPTRFGGQSTALKRMDKMRLCGNCHNK